MLLEASTFLWKMIKLKYYFLIIYSDLLSKVHFLENGIWKVSPNIYLENNISILLFSTKMYFGKYRKKYLSFIIFHKNVLASNNIAYFIASRLSRASYVVIFLTYCFISNFVVRLID